MKKRLGKPFWIWIGATESVEKAIAILEDAIEELKRGTHDRKDQQGMCEHSHNSQ